MPSRPGSIRALFGDLHRNCGSLSWRRSSGEMVSLIWSRSGCLARNLGVFVIPVGDNARRMNITSDLLNV